MSKDVDLQYAQQKPVIREIQKYITGMIQNATQLKVHGGYDVIERVETINTDVSILEKACEIIQRVGEP